MFVRQKTRARKIHLTAGGERDGSTHAGAAFDVAGRDRLAASGAHTDTATGSVSSSDAELIENSFAKTYLHSILRAR
jgi:hypothetical protein